MELCTGVDILRIDRLNQSIQNPRFLARVYGPKERDLYRETGESLFFLAGNFCAKEAFSKALGTGVRGFSLCEVQILRDSLGAPFFALSGNAKKVADQRGLTFSLSISHETEYAVAFVVARTATDGSPPCND